MSWEISRLINKKERKKKKRILINKQICGNKNVRFGKLRTKEFKIKSKRLMPILKRS